jgi:hypothetical protein
MALVHGEDLMKLYALAVERAPARSNRVGAGINGLQSGRAPPQGASVRRGVLIRKSFHRHDSPAVLAADAAIRLMPKRISGKSNGLTERFRQTYAE